MCFLCFRFLGREDPILSHPWQVVMSPLFRQDFDFDKSSVAESGPH
jgi:hypothetical protein